MPDRASVSGATVRVQVRYLSALRDHTGRGADEVALPSGSTLQELAAWLQERYGLSVPGPQVMAALMGRGWDQLEQGLATELREGDVIALFPPVAGG
jgi:MoaD family protein